GLQWDEEKYKTQLIHKGDWAKLIHEPSGRCYGASLLSGNCIRPIFVSIGHRISIETAVRLTIEVCKYRIPEPIRAADHLGREYVRKIRGKTEEEGEQKKEVD
ncbi:MAG: hypothetical protein EZS28_034902, partial [Streblomastix strix]